MDKNKDKTVGSDTRSEDMNLMVKHFPRDLNDKLIIKAVHEKYSSKGELIIALLEKEIEK